MKFLTLKYTSNKFYELENSRNEKIVELKNSRIFIILPKLKIHETKKFPKQNVRHYKITELKNSWNDKIHEYQQLKKLF